MTGTQWIGPAGVAERRFGDIDFRILAGAAVRCAQSGGTRVGRGPKAVPGAGHGAGHHRAQAGDEALRASESRYRELFEANPHPMGGLQTLGFLAVNDAVAHYGYSRDEFRR